MLEWFFYRNVLWKWCSTFTKFQQKIHKKEAKRKHPQEKKICNHSPLQLKSEPPYSKSYFGKKKH